MLRAVVDMSLDSLWSAPVSVGSDRQAVDAAVDHNAVHGMLLSLMLSASLSGCATAM